MCSDCLKGLGVNKKAQGAKLNSELRNRKYMCLVYCLHKWKKIGQDMNLLYLVPGIYWSGGGERVLNYPSVLSALPFSLLELPGLHYGWEVWAKVTQETHPWISSLGNRCYPCSATRLP